MKYEEKKVKNIDYISLLIKYGFRFAVIFLILMAAINRQKLWAYAQENIPIEKLNVFSTLTAKIKSGLNPKDKILAPLNKAKNEVLGSIMTIQMKTFADQIEIYYQMNQAYPSNFEEFLTQEFESKSKEKDINKDLWGNSFKLEINNKGFSIMSAGPDGIFSTSDDIIYEQKRGN